MVVVTQEMKANAEICYGDEKCREKLMSLFKELGLPDNLLEVEEIEECGHVKETGFVWFKHKRKRDTYKVDKISISYDTEVTAYVEPKKIKNLTGVKAKQFWIWIKVSEICVMENNSDALIMFKTPAGLCRSFPLSSFKSNDTKTEEDVKKIEANPDEEK